MSTGPRATATTVLVVDDHRSFAELMLGALEAAGGFRCLGSATTAEEAVRLAAELRPAVLVTDIAMPGTDGLEACRRVRASSPETAVAVVTAHQGGEWVARAARAGASAFIPKGGPLSELVALLREARPGPMRVAPSALPSDPHATGTRSGLTPRQLEVLGYLALGLEPKSIAAVMGISVHTCRGYLKTVYAALHASSRITALNRARELELV
ncbi:response regulator transcription factor [Microlunatus flavus]|uniref:DNA-binding response regulator, NarL/FixJ family, contains REC and HTH domains n=1 Tax=Microlunatus flavus TaxID=1036181 RepID=A0A1H9GA50_9ACTN|nr:response regulator transcription factor [Microlunatus flavus]SEQ46883.1 DNA-binding response regulator, NarL/FixJ family, contains REC and HTH domains [Microlunatus flavus]